MKIKVSERAVFARLNRALAADHQQLKKCKPTARGFSDLGTYYVVDTVKKSLCSKHVDIEVLARRIGALKGYEEVGEYETFGEVQTALADSLLRIAHDDADAVERSKDVRKDAAAFNKQANAEIRTAKAIHKLKQVV